MKIRDATGARIKERLDRLKSRVGHKKLINDFLFPSRETEKNRQIANGYADVLDKKIEAITPLIRSLRNHIDFIGDPDKFVAAYLLIGKSYTSLKSIAILIRQGYSYQIVELCRSSIESLYLGSIFLEDGQEKLLQEWFGGKTIGNRVAREVLHKAVNELHNSPASGNIPMKDALSDMYDIYSEYTHSGYPALFDFIDVFVEDFDFEQRSQFHYNRKNFHLIDNLHVNILLGLKHFYIRGKDQENLAKVEALLSKEGGSFANQEEIDAQFQRYKG